MTYVLKPSLRNGLINTKINFQFVSLARSTKQTNSSALLCKKIYRDLSNVNLILFPILLPGATIFIVNIVYSVYYATVDSRPHCDASVCRPVAFYYPNYYYYNVIDELLIFFMMIMFWTHGIL